MCFKLPNLLKILNEKIELVSTNVTFITEKFQTDTNKENGVPARLLLIARTQTKLLSTFAFQISSTSSSFFFFLEYLKAHPRNHFISSENTSV